MTHDVTGHRGDVRNTKKQRAAIRYLAGVTYVYTVYTLHSYQGLGRLQHAVKPTAQEYGQRTTVSCRTPSRPLSAVFSQASALHSSRASISACATFAEFKHQNP